MSLWLSLFSKESFMKITLTLATTRSRNPLVATARFRQAGSHRRSNGAQRQRAAQALRRELITTKNIP